MIADPHSVAAFLHRPPADADTLGPLIPSGGGPAHRASLNADQHADHMADALADLFLGELTPTDAHDVAVGVTPLKRSAIAASAPPAPGAPPQSHGPAPAASPRTAALSTPGHHSVGPSVLPPSPPQRVPVELLLAGHLPTRPAAWALEYARGLAWASRPRPDVPGRALFIRLMCDGPARDRDLAAANPDQPFSPRLLARVELIGVAAAAKVPEPAASFCDAVGIAAELGICRIVLFVDHALEAPASENAAIARRTLITSADQAGLVAAYAMLKARRLPADSTTRSVGVVFAGCAPADASRAFVGLQRAAAAALALTLPEPVIIQRLGEIGAPPAGESAGNRLPSSTLFQGPTDMALADLLELLASLPASSLLDADDEQALDDTDHSDDAAELDLSLQRIGAAVDEDDPHHADQPPGQPATTRAAPSASPPPSIDLDPGMGRLAEWVPGLRALPGICPIGVAGPLGDQPASAATVELAVDSRGVLHVLARAFGESQVPHAVASLTSAAAWALVNRRLLGLLAGAATTDAVTTPAPTMHLFSDRPAAARGLLDSAIRVHAMARGKSGAWAMVELN